LLLIISLAFNAGFGTTFGVGTYRHYCAEHGDGVSLPDLHEDLNLTPSQQDQMKASKNELLHKVVDLRRELTSQRKALASLLAAPDPERTIIDKQLDKIALLQRKIQECVVDHLLDEKRLLSRKQQESYNEIIRLRVCPQEDQCPESGPDNCEIRGESAHSKADEGMGKEGP